MRVIVFDLYDTLIDKVWFDYDKIIDFLIEDCFVGLEKADLIKVAEEYRKRFMLDRNETNREVSFVDQLKFYEDKLQQRIRRTYMDVEWSAFTRCRFDKIALGAENVLSYFKERGYRLAILSNGIFSSETIKRYLKSFHLAESFEVIVSSADIKVRKPSKRAFDYVLNQLNVEVSNEIFHIGNNLQKDAIGAREVGLTPIFINKLNEDFDGITVESLKGVKAYFEKRFLYLNTVAENESLVDGPGLRTVIFLQGCAMHCVGCHNSETWDMKNGQRISVDELAEKLTKRAKNKKITISGGEPLLQTEAVLELIAQLPDFEICLYTGYALEDVPEKIKKCVKYLKVSKFELDKRTTVLPYVGSSNQKLIDMEKYR